MPTELIEILRPLGPNGAWALVVLFILRWVGERVDKWAEAAIKQAVTNEALKGLIEHITATLVRIEQAIKDLQNGRRV